MEKASNKNEPLISVIIPVYKVEQYLDKCIESVVNQTYKNLEIILVDDGSPDTCPQKCDDWKNKDKRIIVIHKENGGVSSARNEGIAKAKGDWITFVDSDDWLEKKYIKKMYFECQKNKCDACLCSYNRIVSEKVEKISFYNVDTKLTGKQYLINSLNPITGFGFCHMKLYKRNLIDVSFNTELSVGEDALFNEQVATNIKNAYYITDNLYNYRINEHSVVKRYDENYVDKYLKSIIANKQYIFKNYKDDAEIIQNYYNYVAFHVFLIAVNYCYNKNNKNRNKELRRVCNIDEFKTAIKKSNYNNLNLAYKITLFTLKYKLYFVTGLICKIRQMQNNGGN